MLIDVNYFPLEVRDCVHVELNTCYEIFGLYADSALSIVKKTAFDFDLLRVRWLLELQLATLSISGCNQATN